VTQPIDNSRSRLLPNAVASHLAELCEIAGRYGIRSVTVIGSAATGAFSPDRSDLDLLVDFGDYRPGLAKRAIGFHREVELLFGRRVDVVSTHGLRSPHWKAIHEANKVPVYAAA
jgi:predicted nucleotidyltransferase